ncbi:hypothetical protein [Bradyrhizobium cenepequi]|uniref:hypothetical protein n=1 Tax=Bradyrhizobium cenepequi TaxID=2821403 RepID=UPI001CE34167|nr:hypothetical protein [Bradyrhizobium cenepequi]MCA6107533.1 hypothetical protein [Bradyrhizobium cenepequi]
MAAVGAGNQLPSVTVTSPEMATPKRIKRTEQSRRPQSGRNPHAAQSGLPASAASGIAPGSGDSDTTNVRPTAASEMRISGEEVNALPVSRVGEVLEVVPGLIVT